MNHQQSGRRRYSHPLDKVTVSVVAPTPNTGDDYINGDTFSLRRLREPNPDTPVAWPVALYKWETLLRLLEPAAPLYHANLPSDDTSFHAIQCQNSLAAWLLAVERHITDGTLKFDVHLTLKPCPSRGPVTEPYTLDIDRPGGKQHGSHGARTGGKDEAITAAKDPKPSIAAVLDHDRSSIGSDPISRSLIERLSAAWQFDEDDDSAAIGLLNILGVRMVRPKKKEASDEPDIEEEEGEGGDDEANVKTKQRKKDKNNNKEERKKKRKEETADRTWELPPSHDLVGLNPKHKLRAGQLGLIIRLLSGPPRVATLLTDEGCGSRFALLAFIVIINKFFLLKHYMTYHKVGSDDADAAELPPWAAAVKETHPGGHCGLAKSLGILCLCEQEKGEAMRRIVDGLPGFGSTVIVCDDHLVPRWTEIINGAMAANVDVGEAGSDLSLPLLRGYRCENKTLIPLKQQPGDDDGDDTHRILPSMLNPRLRYGSPSDAAEISGKGKHARLHDMIASAGKDGKRKFSYARSTDKDESDVPPCPPVVIVGRSELVHEAPPHKWSVKAGSGKGADRTEISMKGFPAYASMILFDCDSPRSPLGDEVSDAALGWLRLQRHMLTTEGKTPFIVMLGHGALRDKFSRVLARMECVDPRDQPWHKAGLAHCAGSAITSARKVSSPAGVQEVARHLRPLLITQTLSDHPLYSNVNSRLLDREELSDKRVRHRHPLDMKALAPSLVERVSEKLQGEDFTRLDRDSKLAYIRKMPEMYRLQCIACTPALSDERFDSREGELFDVSKPYPAELLELPGKHSTLPTSAQIAEWEDKKVELSDETRPDYMWWSAAESLNDTLINARRGRYPDDKSKGDSGRPPLPIVIACPSPFHMYHVKNIIEHAHAGWVECYVLGPSAIDDSRDLDSVVDSWGCRAAELKDRQAGAGKVLVALVSTELLARLKPLPFIHLAFVLYAAGTCAERTERRYVLSRIAMPDRKGKVLGVHLRRDGNMWADVVKFITKRSKGSAPWET